MLTHRFPLLSFLALILFFAGAYNITWVISPDSFIKNEELNTYPIEDAINLVFEFDNQDAIEIAQVLKSEFRVAIREIALKNKTAINEINSLTTSIDLLQEKEKTEYNKLISKWKENVDDYVLNHTKKYEEKLNNAYIEKDMLISKRGTKKDYQLEVEIANKNIAIAELNYQSALAVSEAHKYTLANISEFHDAELLKTNKSIEKKIRELESERSKKNMERLDLRRKAYDLLSKVEKNNLNYFDFIFYSIGISTTTTFGDIIANSRFIRLLVCMQLLASILLLACITQNFLRKNLPHD
ncbi:ion channel [Serratia fonticola]|uniref:ion channel n=1 Tax=Serratia fonticola TaxID=47917 RepID=UPI00217B27D9|nr:ion channel [Serratia fonticola]CAI0854865.1 Uncharacterised protein [Serratia fonticola]